MQNADNRIIHILSALTDGCLAVFLGPFVLYVGPGGYAGIVPNKGVFFFCAAGGYLLLLAAVLLSARLRGRRIPGRLAHAQKAVLVFWLLSLLSAVFSVDRYAAFFGSARLEGFLTLSLYCALILSVSLWGRAKVWHLQLFLLAMSLNCALALAQLAGLDPFSLYPAGQHFGSYSEPNALPYLGTTGNTNLLSALLCITLALSAAGLLRFRAKQRLLLLVPLALSLSVIFLADVSGAQVAVLLGSLFAAPVLLADPGIRRRRAALFAVAALLCATVFLFLFGQRLHGVLYEASALLHGQWDDRFGSGRLYIWRHVLALIAERPLLGGGPDTLLSRSIAGGILFQRLDEHGTLLRRYIDAAHNSYLNIAVNEGVPALCAALAALFAAAKSYLRLARTNEAAALCGSAVLFWCAQALFEISLVSTTPYFCLCLALLLAENRP